MNNSCNRSPRKALVLLLASIALCACEKPQEKEARYLRHGNELFAQGEYDQARLEYKNAARMAPTDAEPRYRLAMVDEAQGDLNSAFAGFIAAEQQNAHYRPALLKVAQYYMAAGSQEESQKRIDKVLAEAPDDAQAHAIEAALLLKKDDFTATWKEAYRALKAEPGNITAVSVLAGLHIAQNEEAKAEAALDYGIRFHPRELSLLELKVALYERMNDLAKLDRTYQALFALSPADIRYRSALAQTYQKAGQPAKAEATLREGVAALPENWAMKKALVDFLAANRGMDAAEAEIRTLMQTYPRNDELYFWLADLYITQHAEDRAVALLEQIVARNQFDSTGLNARTSLARIQLLRGNRALAQKLSAAVLARSPDNREARFIRAGLSFDEGDYPSAVADLRTLLREDAKNVEAYRLLAEALLMDGHTDVAIDTLGQLLDIAPADAAARVRLAQLYALNGNPRHARDLLAFVTHMMPDYAVGWESTARIAITQKDWPAAWSAIQTLDKMAGQHATAVYLHAEVEAASGNLDGAIPLYLQVISSDPQAPLAEHALHSLVEAYNGANRLQDAVATLKALKGATMLQYSLLGQCEMKLGHPQQAAQAFDQAIALGAGNPEPYIGRASLFIAGAEYDKALAILQESRKRAPSDMMAPMMEAAVLSKLKRYREAAALYEAILERHPGMDTAANNLAEIIADYEYGDSAALEKARQTAERFAYSDNPLYLDTLGWVYYRQGNLQQALNLLERARSAQASMPPEMHYHYATLLLKVGKTEQARGELKQAVVQNASYAGIDDARKLLAGLN